jgi:predicted transcriptional regulator
MKKSQIPGVIVHKSMRDAMTAVHSELERQHNTTLSREKAKAKKAKAAAKKPPG